MDGALLSFELSCYPLQMIVDGVTLLWLCGLQNSRCQANEGTWTELLSCAYKRLDILMRLPVSLRANYNTDISPKGFHTESGKSLSTGWAFQVEPHFGNKRGTRCPADFWSKPLQWYTQVIMYGGQCKQLMKALWQTKGRPMSSIWDFYRCHCALHQSCLLFLAVTVSLSLQTWNCLLKFHKHCIFVLVGEAGIVSRDNRGRLMFLLLAFLWGKQSWPSTWSVYSQHSIQSGHCICIQLTEHHQHLDKIDWILSLQWPPHMTEQCLKDLTGWWACGWYLSRAFHVHPVSSSPQEVSFCRHSIQIISIIKSRVCESKIPVSFP